jgi:hypothetical protein
MPSEVAVVSATSSARPADAPGVGRAQPRREVLRALEVGHGPALLAAFSADSALAAIAARGSGPAGPRVEVDHALEHGKLLAQRGGIHAADRIRGPRPRNVARS